MHFIETEFTIDYSKLCHARMSVICLEARKVPGKEQIQIHLATLKTPNL